MTNTLLGCDPKEVSPARAGAVFAQFAKKLCTDERIDLTQAWKKAATLHPDLLARLHEDTPAEAAPLSNATDRPAPLAQKPFTALAFQLPANVDNSVFEAAWQANGSQSIRVDFKKIFLGLVTFIAQKQSVSADVARRQVQDDYPALARFAGEAVG